MAGKNGSVTSIASNSSGTSVKVHYPADPGPPPVAEHDDIYDDPPAASLQSLRDAFNFGWKIDATGANNSDGGTVTVHK